MNLIGTIIYTAQTFFVLSFFHKERAVC